jgi:hypothetical protein
MNDAARTTRARTEESDMNETTRMKPTTRWRIYLQVVAVLSAIDIASHATFVNEPALVLVGAAIWVAAGFFWTRRGGLGGPVTIGVLALLEIVVSFLATSEFAEDGSYPAWVLPLHVVLMVAALVTVVMTVVSERRTSAG